MKKGKRSERRKQSEGDRGKLITRLPKQPHDTYAYFSLDRFESHDISKQKGKIAYIFFMLSYTYLKI